MKIVKQIELKIVIFTTVKNRCILHGHVFVMSSYAEKLVIKETCRCNLLLKCNKSAGLLLGPDSREK